MGAIHYATNSRLTACGLSTDFAVYTDERETVSCGAPDACGCYAEGYAAGLAAALAIDRRQV